MAELRKCCASWLLWPWGRAQGGAWLMNNSGEGVRSADTPRSHVLDLEYLLSRLFVHTRRRTSLAGLESAR
jgi:hypothetical protein